jgi:hypothetical protein
LKIDVNSDSAPSLRRKQTQWSIDDNGLRKGDVVIPLMFLSVEQGGEKRLSINAKSGYPPFTLRFENLKTDIEWSQLVEMLSRTTKLVLDPERTVKCVGCGTRNQLKNFLGSPMGEGCVKCPLCKMNFQLSSKG